MFLKPRDNSNASMNVIVFVQPTELICNALEINQAKQ